MKTSKTKNIKPIVVASVISGLFMFVSGLYVAGSEIMFPPIMTVIFVISATITISNVLWYNKKYGI